MYYDADNSGGGRTVPEDVFEQIFIAAEQLNNDFTASVTVMLDHVAEMVSVMVDSLVLVIDYISEYYPMDDDEVLENFDPNDAVYIVFDAWMPIMDNSALRHLYLAGHGGLWFSGTPP